MKKDANKSARRISMSKRNSNLMIALFTTLTLLTSSGCTIKPPDDGSDLGSETTAAAVSAAITNAQAGYAFKDAFHQGDTATVQITDDVMGSGAIEGTYTYTVTAVDAQGAHFTLSDSQTTQLGLVTQADWAAGQTLAFRQKMVSRYQKLVALLPLKTHKYLNFAFVKISRLFKSVQIETTQAIGQSTPGTTETSRYFGLTVVKHTLQLNPQQVACSQIPSCKIAATKIDYNQIITVKKNGSSQDERVHMAYDISIEAPGIAIIQSLCASQLVKNGNQQVPLVRCRKVVDFRFGGSNH